MPLSPTPRTGLHGRATRAGRSAARALEFLILTAGRTGEVLGAKWDEVNFAEATVDSSRRAHEGEARAPGAALARRP